MIPSSSDDSHYSDQPLSKEEVLAFLETPEGLEELADAVRKTRRMVGDDANPQFLADMWSLENKLRAFSAGPLPPDLAC